MHHQRVAHRPCRSSTNSTTRSALTPDDGYLHCTFRRENPTTLKQDFVIEDGLRGPGRFLGCVVGIRCFEGQVWYGEGEVKIYKDGDTDYPTICGTGLEDYVGTAWGMGPHVSFYAGSQLDIRRRRRATPRSAIPTSSASTAGTSSTRSCSSAR